MEWKVRDGNGRTEPFNPETTVGLDYEFVERLNALVTEFKERGLGPDAIGALMEHVSETHGVHDDGK